jgi:adenylosuccinate synthase
LDVLSNLPEIKVGVEYKLKGSTMSSTVPADIESLEKVRVVKGVGVVIKAIHGRWPASLYIAL